MPVPRPTSAGAATKRLPPTPRAEKRSGARGSSGSEQAPKSIPREKDLFRYYEALNLTGPFVNLKQLRVAHQLLDRVLLDVPVAAEDLHRVGRDLHRRVGRE